MASEREEGFYWVLQLPEYGGEWIVAFWGHDPHYGADERIPREWWMVADELGTSDETWAEIGARITRDER